ncbi:MFS transporter [Peterkaempfera griseoplana]|uniref:MFS transporter n=1 Tax=Peterkaempfera griseoplana TaxID=66896 RepID=UPI0006E22EA8|nr:MFS transporter [Peterkaempfera griseoplana]
MTGKASHVAGARRPHHKNGLGPAHRRVLAVCMGAGFTTLIDQSVLNFALPDLRGSLQAGATEVQWIVAGYSLAFGLALIPGGRLGDLHGRKPFFIAGIAVFTAFSALAGAADQPWMVILARLLQGLGAGLVNSQVIGTIQDVFSGQDRARALGLYAVTGGVSGALGPPLGGALIAAAGPGLGWRLTFLLNVPFGLVTLLLAVRCLPPPRGRAGHADLDLVGLVLVGALTLTVMLPFIQSSAGAGPLLWALLACLPAAALAGWQRRYARAGRRPLVHPALVRSAPYRLGTVVAMAQFGSGIASSLVLALFLQDGLGMPAVAAAAVSLPSALAMILSSALAWRVVPRFGRHTVTVGLLLSLCALLTCGLTGLLTPRSALPRALALTQFCSGLASGIVVSPNQAFVLRHAPREAAGVAGGLLQMSQRIAAAVCVSAASGVYLRGASTDLAAHRHAYWHAVLACAAVSAVGLTVSLLAARTPEPVPVEAAQDAVRDAVQQRRPVPEPHHDPSG